MVFAEEETLSEVDTKRLIIEENAKSTAAIKQYLDRKTIDYERDMQRVIDKNFEVLDGRIDGFIRKTGFKLGVIWLAATVLGGLIVLLINNQLSKKRYIRPVSHDPKIRETVKIDLDTIEGMK